MMHKSFLSICGYLGVILFLFATHVSANQNSFTWVPNQQTQATVAGRPVGKAVDRGFIAPSVRALDDQTVEITVEIFHKYENSHVSLFLQAVVTDPKIKTPRDRTKVYNIKVLSDKVNDNPDSFYSRRQFVLTYDELNEYFRSQVPETVDLTIGPGTPLFVYAVFSGGHQWGGVLRDGVIYLPEVQGAKALKKSTQGKNAQGFRPTSLDIAFPILPNLARIYSPVADRPLGLKSGGQIRSRVEGEGKYQLTEDEFIEVRKLLFALAEDSQLQNQVLGNEWKVELETRYFQRDPQTKNILRDENGFPVPDPMVDTYYDTQDGSYVAAENNIALRYRWTEGNRTGAWNFKPGIGRMSKNGVVYRVEYGVDTTDDRPESIAAFADSMHSLNPFRFIREVVPGSKPSDFLYPSVKVVDYRQKFKLTHKSGLIIEVSVDDVRAENLRSKDGAEASYYQLEMDIDHLATQSLNAAGNVQGAPSINNAYTLRGLPDGLARNELAKTSDDAFINGRVNLHGVDDLDPKSPILTAKKADFDLAEAVIEKLRDHLLGDLWRPGGQKYALAAAELGLIEKRQPRRRRSQKSRDERRRAREAAAAQVEQCGDLLK